MLLHYSLSTTLFWTKLFIQWSCTFPVNYTYSKLKLSYFHTLSQTKLPESLPFTEAHWRAPSNTWPFFLFRVLEYSFASLAKWNRAVKKSPQWRLGTGHAVVFLWFLKREQMAFLRHVGAMTKSCYFSKQSEKTIISYWLTLGLLHEKYCIHYRLIKENNKGNINSVTLFRTAVEKQCISVTTPSDCA